MTAIHVVGLEDARRNFQRLGEAIQRKHMRIAFNAGGGVIKRDAVPRIKKRTGLLRKSQAVRVVNSRRGWSAVIGASRKAKGRLSRTKAGKLRATRITGNPLRVMGEKIIRPSRYSHLAEAKHHSLRDAATVAGPAAGQKIVSKLVEGLTQETAKLRHGV